MNAVLLLLGLMSGGADLAWYSHYEAGVQAIEAGRADLAIRELEQALALRPEEGLSVPTDPYQYVDYTPHIFLSLAHQMSGKPDTARKHLAMAEESGVAERSDYGRHLVEAQRILLTGLASRPKPARPMMTDYWLRPELLTEKEFESLKTNILKVCDNEVAPPRDTATWYAHYEDAMQAAGQGEREKALAGLLQAVVLRPEPQRHARMYGMWLIDYYPYFQIARLHAQMQNWDCARDALQISKRLDEIAPSAEEFHEFVMLDYETSQRVTR